MTNTGFIALSTSRFFLLVIPVMSLLGLASCRTTSETTTADVAAEGEAAHESPEGSASDTPQSSSQLDLRPELEPVEAPPDPRPSTKEDEAEKSVKGLVWCYERTERLASAYDESGLCESLGSIWHERSTNPTIEFTIRRFEADQSETPRIGIAGTYDLDVNFTHKDKLCHFSARLIARENDEVVDISVAPRCE